MTSKHVSKSLWIIEDFTARTPILGWCLGLLLTSMGATDDAKAAIAKCNNSTIAYFVGVLFISLSEGYEGLMFALLFASVAGAIGGVFGHYGEATTADRVLTPKKETRDQLASYYLGEVAVSVMIGVSAGLFIEIIIAAMPNLMTASTANIVAVELCAAMSVYYSLPVDEQKKEETRKEKEEEKTKDGAEIEENAKRDDETDCDENDNKEEISNGEGKKDK